MTNPIEIRQRAIALIEHLPTERLAAVVQLLEFLSEPSQQVTPSSQEDTLLQTVQRHFSADRQRRLEELRDRCEWAELTEDEHQELIRYEDLLEQQNAERLAALIELAKLRNADLVTLKRQLRTQYAV